MKSSGKNAGIEMFQKITHGFVVQTFNDEGVCLAQEFIAGDSEYEDIQGNPIECPEIEHYQTFDMKKPL